MTNRPRLAAPLLVALLAAAGCGQTGTPPEAAPTTDAPPATAPATAAAPSTTVTLPPTTTTTAPPPPPPPAPPWEPGEAAPEIAVLQTRLNQLGYRAGPADGRYGSATASAVMAFQKREGLPRDGVAGPATLARLDAPIGAGPDASAPGPRIEVHLDRQIAFVIDAGGGVTTLNASTGNGERFAYPGRGTSVAVTPTGSYAVYLSREGYDEGPLGSLYRPLYFTGGVAVHGSSSVPAYPASHGCVRVSNADMDWVRTVAGVGTPVSVR